MSGRQETLDLRRGYASIATAASETDAVSAYKEFHLLLEELQPDADTVLSAATQKFKLLQIINSVRAGEIKRPASTLRYFIGTGIMLVGHSNGEILAGSYKGENDIVAEHHGSYQYVALRKLGQAALLGHTEIGYAPSQEAYQRLQMILEEASLSIPQWPHHLGYALSRISAGDFLTAAASGMLPTDGIAQTIAKDYPATMATGRLRGWYDWAEDESAGLHDAVAAASVLAHLWQPEIFDPEYSSELVKLTPNDFPGANIH